MKLQIVETPEYILAVSDESIKEGDLYLDDINTIRKSITSDEEYWKIRAGYKKIIAYLPKGNTRKLDLLLLPEMVIESDVDLKLQHRNFSKQVKNPYLTEEKEYQVWESAYIEGFDEAYKAATKVYSEEDLDEARKIGQMGLSDKRYNEFKQSLKQHKPKWFVAEMEYQDMLGNWYPITESIPIELMKCPVRLKTITINGYSTLKGHYE